MVVVLGQAGVGGQGARRVVLLARPGPLPFQDGVADAVQAVDDHPVLQGAITQRRNESKTRGEV